MPPSKTPTAPNGWEFGTIVQRSVLRATADKVMFIAMCERGVGPVLGLTYFYGITLATDAYGKRIGREGRIDLFPIGSYKPHA